MNIRAPFSAVSVEPLELWGRQLVADLSTMQMSGLCDAFSLEPVFKEKYRGYTFKIRGAFSEDRYKNRGLDAAGISYVAERKLNQGIIEGRRKLVDFYIHFIQPNNDKPLSISFSSMGLSKHVKAAGGVEDLGQVDDESYNRFIGEVERVFSYSLAVFEGKAQTQQRRLEVQRRKAQRSPWGQAWKHEAV